MHNLTIALQALVAAAIFFVWVVRYQNIIEEFEQYSTKSAPDISTKSGASSRAVKLRPRRSTGRPSKSSFIEPDAFARAVRPD